MPGLKGSKKVTALWPTPFIAACAEPHKKGYIVACARSNEAAWERGIIGHVCGEREFKETWTQAVARHEAKLRDAEVREELARFLESIGDIEPRLQKLLARLEMYDAIYNVLSIDARDFMRSCANACRSGSGRLEGHNYSGRKLTHKLEGHPFFLGPQGLRKAKMLLSGIGQARRMAEQPETQPHQLREHLSKVRNLGRSVSEIEAEAEECATALKPSNIAGAIRAVDPGERGVVRVNGNILEVQRLVISKAWIPLIDLARPTLPKKAFPWGL